MMFNRKQLCILADCSLEQFKNVTTRGRASAGENFLLRHQQQRGGGYLKYDEETVIRLAFAVEASAERGFTKSFDLACEIHLPEAGFDYATPYYVGIVNLNSATMSLSGNWANLAAFFERNTPGHLMLYEISSIVKAIQARAALFAIPFWAER